MNPAWHSFSRTKIIFSVLLILVINTAPALVAQEKQAPIIAKIYSALRDANYPLAVSRTDSALANYYRFAPAELAKIHTLRALLYDYSGNKAEVSRQFQLALELDPSVELDPLFFSPQLQKLLQDLKTQLSKAGPSKQPQNNDLGQPQIRYLTVADPRIAAAKRSLVLPGWGQFYKGHKRRGYLFAGGTAGLAVATLTVHLLRQRAERDYLAAKDANTIQTRYDTFNRYHKLRQNLALITGLVWMGNFIDALFSTTPQQLQKVGLSSPQIFATHNSFAIQFTLRLH